MVSFFSAAASESLRTGTLEGEPEVSKLPEVSEVPGCWNKLKKQTHARIPKPGEAIIYHPGVTHTKSELVQLLHRM